MSPARRSIKRRDWPRGLREPRPGYFTFDHPDGRSFVIGRVPLAVAKNEAMAANAHIAAHQPSLVERITGATKTVSALLDEMPVPANANTAKSTRSLDKIIRAAIGRKSCCDLSVMDCAELVDGLAKEGKARQAEAVRSRLIAVCKKGQTKGWMDDNPAEVTERPAVTVKRGRLTLETFRAIYAVAGEVTEWLPHAMMLALVTGQYRVTVASMDRQTLRQRRRRRQTVGRDSQAARRFGWSAGILILARGSYGRARPQSEGRAFAGRCAEGGEEVTAKIRKEALRQMEADLATKQDGPFVREGEKTFQRYDEIRVIQRRPGVVDVEFRWRGKLTNTMHIDCDFSAGNLLTLTGVDGRMSVRLF